MIDADPKNNKGGRSSLVSEANNLLSNKTLKDKALSYFRVREFHKDKNKIYVEKALNSFSTTDYFTNYVPEPPRYLIKFKEKDNPDDTQPSVSGSSIPTTTPNSSEWILLDTNSLQDLVSIINEKYLGEEGADNFWGELDAQKQNKSINKEIFNQNLQELKELLKNQDSYQYIIQAIDNIQNEC